jgi:hypothetical protein
LLLQCGTTDIFCRRRARIRRGLLDSDASHCCTSRTRACLQPYQETPPRIAARKDRAGPRFAPCIRIPMKPWPAGARPLHPHGPAKQCPVPVTEALGSCSASAHPSPGCTTASNSDSRTQVGVGLGPWLRTAHPKPAGVDSKGRPRENGRGAGASAGGGVGVGCACGSYKLL